MLNSKERDLHIQIL